MNSTLAGMLFVTASLEAARTRLERKQEEAVRTHPAPSACPCARAEEGARKLIARDEVGGSLHLCPRVVCTSFSNPSLRTFGNMCGERSTVDAWGA